jgi:hypothetical protein
LAGHWLNIPFATGGAFDKLSSRLWSLALSPAANDLDEFVAEWASIVEFCNEFGRSPAPGAKGTFTHVHDPHDEHDSIPRAKHGYLKKLFYAKDQ